MDLASAVEFDLAAARQSIQSVRPGMEVLELSSKTGEGMDRWTQLLTARRSASTIHAPVSQGSPTQPCQA